MRELLLLPMACPKRRRLPQSIETGDTLATVRPKLQATQYEHLGTSPSQLRQSRRDIAFNWLTYSTVLNFRGSRCVG